MEKLILPPIIASFSIARGLYLQNKREEAYNMNNRYRNDDRQGDLEAQVKTGLRKWGPIAGIGFAAVLAFGLSYKPVGQRDLGVVTSLGQYSRTLEPGPHFIVPIIEHMTPVDVQSNQSVEIGFRTINLEKGEFRGADDDENLKKEAQMLTADENIVWAPLVLQYKVDPARVTDYVFNIKDPERTIRLVGEAALRQTVGDYGVDEVLTSGRPEINAEVKEVAQELFDKYGFGIEVQNCYLQQTTAPSTEGVANAFRDVETARQTKDSRINDALSYQNRIVTQAKGDAGQIKALAEGQKATRIGEAQRDVGEFNLLLQQYLLDPVGTENRLYLETMELIYPNIDKRIFDSALAKGNILPILNLSGTNGGN
jgi:modulator of FtsH protease HflK